MVEIGLSKEAKAKIARGDFSQEDVVAATNALLTHISRAGKGQSYSNSLVQQYRERIAVGADINCSYKDTRGDMRDCLSDLIGIGNKGSLRALLQLGARPHEQTRPIKEVIDVTPSDRNIRGHILLLLLRYGVGHVAQCERGSFTLDNPQLNKTADFYLIDHNGEVVGGKRTQEHVRRAKEGSVDGVMKHINAAAKKAMGQLLVHKEAASPIKQAKFSADDLIVLHITLWFREPEVKAALVKDVPLLREMIKDLPPLVREGYEGLAREMTASMACSTISGPAQNWRAVEASESQEAAR